jgi:hypothetical protein
MEGQHAETAAPVLAVIFSIVLEGVMVGVGKASSINAVSGAVVVGEGSYFLGVEVPGND